MKRRTFLKYGAYSIASIAIGSGVRLPNFFKASHSLAVTHDAPLIFTMKEVLAEMVDRTQVPMWAFEDNRHGPRIPGSALFVDEGETVIIEIRNMMDEVHAFAIPGVVRSPDLSPGQSAIVTFTAPPAGTYMYMDPLNAPVNRVMGLHGALVSQPVGGNNTPFGNPTSQVQQLFDALGTRGDVPTIFPGDPWTADRTRIWLMNSIDPKKNRQVADLPEGQTMDPRKFKRKYLPTYFTLSGETGFFSSHNPEIFPHGNIGQPLVLRVMNAGLSTHSPHIHGNHVYQLSSNGKVTNNPLLIDTWTMAPGATKDLLLPFIAPPDAHPWPPSNIREFPMPFAMHCHNELSQTAAGGNYPHGLITDWEITSPQVGGPEASQDQFPFFRGMDPALFK